MTTTTTTIRITEGLIRGKVCLDINQRNFYSFQGIPYAKPPLGKLRFKSPLPAEKWEGIRDATQEGPQCYSVNLITNVIGGSEDCLYLNVYTPKIKNKTTLPVMFWIHGGGFIRGSGGTDLFGPDYLVTHDVVLVTINYRLGPLGFLAFSDPSTEVTGNAGLKDIVMALKWVQKNIKKFSGDPKNVTIFGESAGAAAVHFLMLSPMAKGLFHKGICQSGCALNCFTRGKVSSTYELALKLGIDSTDNTVIINYLQTVPIEVLFQAFQEIRDPIFISKMRPFGPVIEPTTSKDAFLTEEPYKLIKSGNYQKVPMMIGYNSLEGVFVYICMKTDKTKFLSDESLVPFNMNLRIGCDEYKGVANKIRKFYGINGNESFNNNDDIRKALEVYSHNYFTTEICRAAKLHCRTSNSPLYFYRFDLETELNILKKVSRLKLKGASHADDIPYLFSTVLVPHSDPGSKEDQEIRKMTKLWTNFAKFANPTPSEDLVIKTQWKPANSKCFNYLSMDNDGFKMRVDPDREAMAFWEDLYNQHQMVLSKL